VEDALAALHGAADGVVVQQIGLAEDQPLGGAVQRLEVRVLRVICHTHRVRTPIAAMNMYKHVNRSISAATLAQVYT
jgi:hypothetical protein